MGILFFVFLSVMSGNLARAGLCEQKRKEFEDRGKTVISCQEVDFEVKAISADYQKRQTEPVAIYPDKVTTPVRNEGRQEFAYVNSIPGIKNSLFYNPIVSSSVDPLMLQSRGHSLLYKLNLLMIRDKQNHRDEEMLEWIRDGSYGLKFELTPDPARLPWEGRCDLWAAWSIDPEVRKMLDRDSAGLLCHDIPFSRGELKELMSVLYTRSDIERRLKLKGFFEGRDSGRGDHLEDLNIALVKLGVFGKNSDFSPDGLLELGREAKKQGRNLIFEMDPGEEVWNHPVEVMADLVYEDSSSQEETLIRARNLQPVSPLGHSLRTEFLQIETALESYALRGVQARVNGLCEVAERLEAKCPQGKWALSEQVDFLRELQRKAILLGHMQVSGVAAELHSFFVQYGVEGGFARSEDEPSRVRRMDYKKVGSDSFWSPRVVRLSEACRGGAGVQGKLREDRNGLFHGTDFRVMCDLLSSDLRRDRNIFWGSLPPGKIEYFFARSKANESGQSKDPRVRVYRNLTQVMNSCVGIASATGFLLDLEKALAQGSLSGLGVERLSERFHREKALLDPGYVENRILDKLGQGYYPGFGALLGSIRQDR